MLREPPKAVPQSAADIKPTADRYTSLNVDSLTLSYFAKRFGNPVQMIKSAACASIAHIPFLDTVAFSVFSDGSSNTALFRVVKDFDEKDSSLAPSPTMAGITSLDAALDAYRRANIPCRKLVIPVAMTAEMHFRLLVIEPAESKDKKTQVTFYDSRPSVIPQAKQLLHSTQALLKAVAVNLYVISDYKDSTPSITKALDYIKKSCEKSLGGIDFKEIHQGEQYNDVDCGVYTTHYALDAAIDKPRAVDIIKARQLDAVSLATIFPDSGETHFPSVKGVKVVDLEQKVDAKAEQKAPARVITIHPVVGKNPLAELQLPQDVKESASVVSSVSEIEIKKEFDLKLMPNDEGSEVKPKLPPKIPAAEIYISPVIMNDYPEEKEAIDSKDDDRPRIDVALQESETKPTPSDLKINLEVDIETKPTRGTSEVDVHIPPVSESVAMHDEKDVPPPSPPVEEKRTVPSVESAAKHLTPDIEDVKRILIEMKKLVSQYLENYISSWSCCLFGFRISWKFSLFGHHHDDRAVAVKRAIKKCDDLKSIENILQNQKSIFDGVDNKDAPRDGLGSLDFRWKHAKFLRNSKSHKSEYYQAIEAGLGKLRTARPRIT